jgi:autotransporter-associated beta strand protein
MTHRTKLHRMACVVMLFSGAAIQAQNSDGYWSKGGGGSWASANNWDSGIIADGEDNFAYFGLSVEPTIPHTATFTLDGARSIGNIEFLAQSGPDAWVLNTGSGGALTLDASFSAPLIEVGFSSQTVTINLVLAGTNGMEKSGVGTLVLAGANTYTGETTVSAGTLQVNGTVSDAVTVASGVLTGTGVILGPVTVQGGSTLAPGGAPGALAISNSLALQAGGTTSIQVNSSTLAHDTVNGLSAVSYGGTLVVSNVAGTLSVGKSFAIFNAASASGDFSSITPQLTNGLRWRFAPATGALSVISTASQPQFEGVNLSGASLMLQVANGAPGVTNYLLTSTNLSLPLTNWARLGTNVFDVSGNGVFTNVLNAGSAQGFYLISVPPTL